MKNEKTKVGFYLKPTTKEHLDKLRDLNISPNDMLDTLLSFDDEAAQLFMEIYRKVNKERLEGFNYLYTSQGTLVFSEEYAEKIKKLPVQRMTDEDVAKVLIDEYEKNEELKKRFPIEQEFAEIKDRSSKAVRAVASLVDNYYDLKKRVEELEKRIPPL